jgi:hypothetical protein
MSKMKNKTVIPDPMISEVALEIGGERFSLCFDFAALATAKAKLREYGVTINLLHALNFSEMDVDTVPALFFAATQRHQPDLSWEHAQQLVNLRTVSSIFNGLAAAYKVAVVEPKQNPPQADRQS